MQGVPSVEQHRLDEGDHVPGGIVARTHDGDVDHLNIKNKDSEEISILKLITETPEVRGQNYVVYLVQLIQTTNMNPEFRHLIFCLFTF